jgi:hypothetical protein
MMGKANGTTATTGRDARQDQVPMRTARRASARMSRLISASRNRLDEAAHEAEQQHGRRTPGSSTRLGRGWRRQVEEQQPVQHVHAERAAGEAVGDGAEQSRR